jgi:hypothetical protein
VIQGGDAFANYEEFDPGFEEDTIGSFSGSHESMNVRNALPEHTYYYCHNERNRLIRFLNRGWEAVGSDDPEQFGTQLLDERIRSQVDGMREYQDVVLLRIPNETLRKYRDRQAAERVDPLAANENQFFAEGQELERRGFRSRGGPLRYASNDHGMEVVEMDHDGNEHRVR